MLCGAVKHLEDFVNMDRLNSNSIVFELNSCAFLSHLNTYLYLTLCFCCIPKIHSIRKQVIENDFQPFRIGIKLIAWFSVTINLKRNTLIKRNNLFAKVSQKKILSRLTRP